MLNIYRWTFIYTLPVLGYPVLFQWILAVKPPIKRLFKVILFSSEVPTYGSHMTYVFYTGAAAVTS